MAFTQPTGRRRRKRRLGLTVLLLLIAGGAVAGIVWLRSEQQRLSDYLDLARGVSTTYDGIANDIHGIVVDIDEMGRPLLVDRLESSARLAAEANETLRSGDPPSKAGAANGSAVIAAEAWADGMVLMRDAVLVLLDDPDDLDALDRLNSAFIEFQVGDRAYSRFQEELLLLGDDVTLPYPDVRFVPFGEEPLYQANVMTRRIRELVPELRTRFDVAVSSVRFDPEPAGDNDGVPVIPFSETLSAQVTITNRGNEPISNLLVTMFLVRAEEGAAGETVELQQIILMLEATESTVLTFTDLDVEPGSFYEVIVRADLAEDEDPESNEYRQVIFRNGSS